MTSLNKMRVNRRVGSLFAVAALVLATVTPGLVPAFASAAQLTERSVKLSSSSKAATNVSYEVTFTRKSAAGAVVFDFCENSPLIWSTCTAPAGFTAATAATSTAGFTVSQTTAADANTVKAVGSITAAPTTITLTGVTNPSAAGPLYVRMITFDTSVNADAYASAAPQGSRTGATDDGSAAVSITDTIGVSAAVLETLTFCVSGALVTTEGCGTTTSASLALGELTGSVRALDATKVSEGDIYSQISTNAASGAVVNMKSSAANCGGLLLNGLAITGPEEAAKCFIKHAASGITAGTAGFGLKVAAAANPGTGTNSSGAFGAATAGAFYSDSIFKINYATGNLSGVTGPYGDPVLDTSDAPASNKNAKITFGATIGYDTPAGLYSADFSLIATGKF